MVTTIAEHEDKVRLAEAEDSATDFDRASPLQGEGQCLRVTVMCSRYSPRPDCSVLAAGAAGFVAAERAVEAVNSNDFSALRADKRLPHADLAQLFAVDGSSYGLGVEGLDAILAGRFGDEFQELVEDSDFEDEPRRLDEIQEAEQELFDRIWYRRSMSREWKCEDSGDQDELVNLGRIAGPARQRVEEKFGVVENLGPYDDFEWGMLNGKRSAPRWVPGSVWDFLDT